MIYHIGSVIFRYQKEERETERESLYIVFYTTGNQTENFSVTQYLSKFMELFFKVFLNYFELIFVVFTFYFQSYQLSTYIKQQHK